ncbi:MAG: tetratricopeptide repeat-containing sulfotransferase family protein [Povalibacter sp.]
MPVPAGFPLSLRPLLSTAETAAASKDFARAIATYEHVLQQLPEDPYTLVQLSYMHSLAGEYRSAESCALRAAQTGTRDTQILLELLPRLRTFNRVQEMLACIERVTPMRSMPIPLLIAAAAQLTYVNLAERAILFLDEARRADPDYPPTLLARTQVLMYLGRFTEAEEDVRRAIRRAPEIAQSYWLQAGLRRQTTQSNHVNVINRELRRSTRSADDVATLSFALHKELDDVGEYEAAWHALMQGCRAKRSRLQYDDAANAKLFDALAAFQPVVPETTVHSSSAENPTPIFIVGMHRSGTTLLEQMLAGHSQIQAIGELYDFTSAMRYVTDHHCKGVIDELVVQKAATIDLSRAGEHYRRSTQWRVAGKKFFTDKLPSNFLNLGFIVRALPDAKIIHMVRDPIETCFSNLRELFSEANAFSYDMVELGRYYGRYRRLMQRWHAQHPNRILDIHYSDLVREPDQELRRVAAFLGEEFESEMMNSNRQGRSVVTASAVQVRNKIEGRDRPKWLPYEQWLGPLLERLAL